MNEIKIPKDKGFLYAVAKTDWEYAKGLGLSFDDAVYYLKTLLKWAEMNGYLMDAAKPFLNLDSLPKNFELRSWMFTDEFNNKIPKVFDKWCKKIKYGDKTIDMKIIEEALSKK